MPEPRSRLHASFAGAPQVRRALRQLAADGVRAGDIEVRSAIPLAADIVPAGMRLSSRVPLTAILGGLLGGAGAYLLATLPPALGGTPAASGPPVAVITFEGAAVGAILFAVATVLRECRLLRWGHIPGPFDGQLAAGQIVVAVDCAEDAAREWAAEAIATEMRTGAAHRPNAAVPRPSSSNIDR